MKMEPDARLALEARARAGDAESISGWILSSAWRSISARKDLTPKDRVRAFVDICSRVTIKVEA